MQIPPDMPLAVTLAAQQWLLVQQILGEGPYRLVQPLIGEIQRQCVAHAEQRQPEPEFMPRRTNGGMAATETARG
jgi:hypothetical protein